MRMFELVALQATRIGTRTHLIFNVDIDFIDGCRRRLGLVRVHASAVTTVERTARRIVLGWHGR